MIIFISMRLLLFEPKRNLRIHGIVITVVITKIEKITYKAVIAITKKESFLTMSSDAFERKSLFVIAPGM